MKILFIQTGGTIDKDYPRSIGGYAFEISTPAVARILPDINPGFSWEIISAMKKDSQEISEDDRQALLNICEDSDHEYIIITHGTDTMIETARYLSGSEGKVIVLTGAMRPERFSNSDAAFNLGTAIGAVQILPKGVYIAMHGGIFRWDRCNRDPDTGQFVAGQGHFGSKS